MGVRNASVAANPASALTIVTTTELNVISLPALNTPLDNTQVLISGILNLITGTGVNLLTLGCRRVTPLTGVPVGTNLIMTAAASTQYLIPFFWIDSPGVVAGLVYNISVVQGAATGNGSVQVASAALAYVL